MHYSIPVNDPCQVLDSIGEETYGQKISTLICQPGFFIDNNTPESYTDLIIEVDGELPEGTTAIIEGGEYPIYPILGGYRPTNRPTPRPR